MEEVLVSVLLTSRRELRMSLPDYRLQKSRSDSIFMARLNGLWSEGISARVLGVAN